MVLKTMTVLGVLCLGLTAGDYICEPSHMNGPGQCLTGLVGTLKIFLTQGLAPYPQTGVNVEILHVRRK